MTKVNCPCGNQMSDVGFPSHYVRMYITQKQWDDMPEAIPAAQFGEVAHEFWQCDQCGRLGFGDDPIRWYRPEFEVPEPSDEHDGEGTLP